VLIDINEQPIRRITDRGMEACETEHEFDVIILATVSMR
jgi:cyclohexanone monooxygenase